MYLEFPCYFNKDESFLKELDQEMGCLNLRNCLHNKISEINDGSVVIFAPADPHVEKEIREYISEKNNEIWVELV